MESNRELSLFNVSGRLGRRLQLAGLALQMSITAVILLSMNPLLIFLPLCRSAPGPPWKPGSSHPGEGASSHRRATPPQPASGRPGDDRLFSERAAPLWHRGVANSFAHRILEFADANDVDGPAEGRGCGWRVRARICWQASSSLFRTGSSGRFCGDMMGCERGDQPSDWPATTLLAAPNDEDGDAQGDQKHRPEIGAVRCGPRLG